MPLADGANEPHDLRQFAARHDAVLRDVIRAQAANRPEGALAAFPQRGALGIVPGQAHFAGLVLTADFIHLPGLLLDAVGQAVQFNDQHRSRIEREAESIRLLQRLRDQLIHHLERGRHDAGGDDIAHRPAGLFHAGEHAQEGLERRGSFGEAHQRASHDAEHAFRADAGATQVVAAHLLAAVRLDTEPLNRAVGQHHLVAEHVVGGDAVFQRVRPSGVGGNVAADRAGRLARRIGGVKQTVLFRIAGDPGVHAAGLDQSPAVSRIDVQHAVHPREGDHDTTINRQHGAAQARAGPARDDGQIQFGTQANNRGHFPRRLGQHNGGGEVFLEGVGVALVNDKFLFVGEHGIVTDNFNQAAGEVLFVSLAIHA